jgi:hypothetical protein
MGRPLKPLGNTNQRKAYLTALAKELEAFLLFLQKDSDQLVSYVEDPFGYLKSDELAAQLKKNKLKLSDEAKAILLQSDYAVVQEVMGYRQSTAVRWVCSWVV